MRICNKHGSHHWYGGIVPSETCDVCKLENALAEPLQAIERIAIYHGWHERMDDSPWEFLDKALRTARRALLNITRRSTDDLEPAMFAHQVLLRLNGEPSPEKVSDMDICNEHNKALHLGNRQDPAHPDDCVLCENERLRERLDHALAALRHISRTCIEDPDTAQFACAASNNPPAAFAPKQDYERQRCLKS